MLLSFEMPIWEKCPAKLWSFPRSLLGMWSCAILLGDVLGDRVARGVVPQKAEVVGTLNALDPRRSPFSLISVSIRTME